MSKCSLGKQKESGRIQYIPAQALTGPLVLTPFALRIDPRLNELRTSKGKGQIFPVC